MHRSHLRRSSAALAASLVLAMLVAGVVATIPATAGEVTQSNACRWVDDALRPVTIKVRGEATPASPAYGDTVTLADLKVGGTLPWWTAEAAYTAGLIRPGPNTISVKVSVKVLAANSSPASRTVSASGPVSINFDPNLPFTPAGQSGQLFVLSNLALPNTAWVRNGQAPVAFSQGTTDIRVTAGALVDQPVFTDCRPATWTDPEVPVFVTAPPFETVGIRLPDASFSDVPYGSVFFEEIEWLVAEGVATGYAGGTFAPQATVTRQTMAAFLYRSNGSPFGPDPTCAAAPFPDVAVTDPFCGEIAWLAASGITSGNPAGMFAPTAAVSRQAMALFLYRDAGSPNGSDPVCTSSPFIDIAAAQPFCGEIAWLVASGATTGFPDNTFRPATTVSRQSTAAFLFRLADH